MPDSLFDRGSRFFDHGVYDRALEDFFEVLEVYEPAQDTANLLKVYNLIGRTYNELRNYGTARSYYFKMLVLFPGEEPIGPRATAYNNLGMVYQNLHKIDSAQLFYQQSLDLKRIMKDSAGISRSLNNLGTLALDQGNLQQALDYYFESLAIKKELLDTSGMAVTYGNIGDIFGHFGKFDSTEKYLNIGYEFAQKVGELPSLINFYHNLSELNRVKGNWEEVVRYKDLYIQANDSLFNLALAEGLAARQMVYEIDKRERELELAENKIALEESRTQLLSIAVGALLALAILLYFLIRLRGKAIAQNALVFEKEKAIQELKIKEQEKEKAIQELKIKEQEKEKSILQSEVERKQRKLLGASMQTYQKNETILKLQEEIAGLKKQGATVESILQRTERLLLETLNVDRDWDDFKLHFEEVNPLFFDHLHKNYEGLSQTDLRHCAYIRIGLSTKEISRLMNIAPASVQKSRVRLKKKLQLSREADLYSFIRNL